MRLFENSFKHASIALVIGLSLFTTGCSSLASKKVTDNTVVFDEEQSLYYSAPELSSEKPPVTYRPIEADTLNALLTAEIAGHRKRFDIALDQYLLQTQKTKDPDIAERTVRIALFMGSSHHALEALKVWIEVEPKNPILHQTAAQVLMESGDFKQALVHMQELQALTGTSQYDFLAANAGHLPSSYQQDLLTDLQIIKESQPNNASLLYAEGLMQQHLKQYQAAYDSIEQALKANPNLLSGSLQKARVLVLLDRSDDAIKWLAKLRKKHPNNKGVQVLNARILLEQHEYDKAHAAFNELHNNFPDDSNILLSLALLNDELGYPEEAKSSFYQLIINEEHLNEAHYYLGRLSEESGDTQEAISHYSQVAPSREFLAAQLKGAYLIHAEHGFLSAQEFLHDSSEQFPKHKTELMRIELELLINEGQYQDAYELISTVLEQLPNSTDLLYTRAMIGDKLDDLDILETDLRKILTLQPNHADALNALGYTLADRTDRLEEAHTLVLKAYQIKPNNPAIMDSLGWVHFRQGNYDEALPLLEEAFGSYPDHEIAAHLGELYWVTGKQKEAIEVWQAGLENNPDSKTIHSTLERLNVNIDDWHTETNDSTTP